MASIKNLISSIKKIKRPAFIYFAVLLNLIYVLANIPLIISTFTPLIGMKAFGILTNHSTELLIITCYCGRTLLVLALTYGLLTLNKWVWFLQNAFSFLIILCLLAFFDPMPMDLLLTSKISPLISVIWGVLNLIIIAGFLTKGVRNAFFTDQPSKEEYLNVTSDFKDPGMTYRNMALYNHGNKITMDFSINNWMLIPIWVGLFFGWFVITVIFSLSTFYLWMILGVLLTIVVLKDKKSLLIDARKRKLFYKSIQWAFINKNRTFDFNEISNNGFCLIEKDLHPLLLILIRAGVRYHFFDTTMYMLIVETNNKEKIELVAFEEEFFTEIEEITEQANRLIFETEESVEKKQQGLM